MSTLPEFPSNLRHQIEDGALHPYVADDTKVRETTTLVKMRVAARERVEALGTPIEIAIKYDGVWYRIDVIYPDKYAH